MAMGLKNNFSVSLLFVSINENKEESEFLWEESIYLIVAEDEMDAKKQAMVIGRNLEHVYESVDGSIIEVKFFGVERVFQVLDDLAGGCEIFSRFLRAAEVKSLLKPFDEG